MSTSLTSIIDRPRTSSEKDLFGIDKYQQALVSFIKTSDTPITIAIQGEWGSGKTSLMNTLKTELCDGSNTPYYGIWLNTWQYSLMRTPEETLTRIILGLTKDIMKVIEENSDKSKTAQVTEKISKGLSSLFKGAAKIGVNVVANQVGIEGAGDLLDNLLTSSEKDEEAILSVRNGLEEAIASCLAMKNNEKRGFLFFVDDLDRIDPPVAVQILELLKNIFDINHCIFILAIDYDVVIKGLKPKFGELTDKNEREFRSFFDKIIQLPFSMPVSSYQVGHFIGDTIQKIDLFSVDEIKDEKNIAIIAEMAEYSVGTNPRSLKRLMNTLSLIQIINVNTGNHETQQTWQKMVNFGLVCTQIAYPFLYELLVNYPDFTAWNNELLKRYKIKNILPEELSILSENQNFDEEWEQVLYQICQKDAYLSNRVYLISSLFNKIREVVPQDTPLGEAVESILTLSAVTSVTTSEKPKSTKVNAAGRDISKYYFDGKPEKLAKRRLAFEVFKKYVTENPTVTYEQLKKLFPEDVSKIADIPESRLDRYFAQKKTDIITLSDGNEIAFSNQWSKDSLEVFLKTIKQIAPQYLLLIKEAE